MSFIKKLSIVFFCIAVLVAVSSCSKDKKNTTKAKLPIAEKKSNKTIEHPAAKKADDKPLDHPAH